MNLKDFCTPFHSNIKADSGLLGIKSQPDIAMFFMETALGENNKLGAKYSPSLFTKWFTGEREPDIALWKKIKETFDKSQFSSEIEQHLNENALSNIFENFSIAKASDEEIDKSAFSMALAEQFYAIVKGNGRANNIINEMYHQIIDVFDLHDYVNSSHNKYSKLKTLLYSSQERSFDEFFVCNTITRPRHMFRDAKGEREIKNVTLEKLAESSLYTLLIGMGGIGKSMMMRHLFLSSIRGYSKGKKLPILVTLREFGSDNNLIEIINDSVARFDGNFTKSHLLKFLKNGQCQILLDGLDEIKPADMNKFQRQLDGLVDKYSNNQFVMSARRFSTFVELHRFAIMRINPFTKEQALELIDRLEYCPEEPRLKQQFRERLEEDYFHSHNEFARNPLLLTLMLMNFHRFADVPEKTYLFYEQAYQTLLQRHDSDKLAYKRVFHSVSDPSDFTRVFSEFCAKSYRKGDYEFSQKLFSEYFSKTKAVARLNSKIMTADNFLFDTCNSACLMYEEGQSFHFLHRSFQEYFFADYYSKQDDMTLRKLGDSLTKLGRRQYDESSAFDMLYDLAPEKVERFILLPYLEEIYGGTNEQEQYWRFLANGYNSICYIILDKEVSSRYEIDFLPTGRFYREQNLLEPSCIVMYKILKILGKNRNIRIKLEDEKYAYDELMEDKIYAELVKDNSNEPVITSYIRVSGKKKNEAKYIRRALADRFKDKEKCDPVLIGVIYIFDFSKGLTHREKYTELVDYLENADCPTRQLFMQVKDYYQDLKERAAKALSMDDDDF